MRIAVRILKGGYSLVIKQLSSALLYYNVSFSEKQAGQKKRSGKTSAAHTMKRETIASPASIQIADGTNSSSA